MKVQLEQIKPDDKFHGKYSGFVDSEFVKTCDELVKGWPAEVAFATQNGIHS